MLDKIKELRENDPKKFKSYIIIIVVGILFQLVIIIGAKITYCDHEYTVIEEVAPTYTEDGKVVKECTHCGDRLTETLSALTPPPADDGLLEEDVTEVEGELPDVEAEVDSEDLVNELMALGFTEEEATEYREVFLKCGVNSIEGAEPSDLNATIDGLIAYRIVMDDDRTLRFTIDKRELFYIGLNGTDVYDTRQGGFLITIDDVHIPEKTISASVKGDLGVKTQLVLDSYFIKAIWYSNFAYGRSDDNYVVRCDVYAENRMGFKDTVRAFVYYEFDGEKFVVTAVSIDGIRYK